MKIKQYIMEKSAENKVVLFVNSRQGQQLSKDGAEFTYPLRPPIVLPMDSNPELKVIECDVVYNQPNIMQKSSLFISIFNGVLPGTVKDEDHAWEKHTGTEMLALTNYERLFELEFERGLYTLDDIKAAIEEHCNRYDYIHDNAFTVDGIAPTQKAQIDYDSYSAQKSVIIHWSGYPKTNANEIVAHSDVVGKLMGFTTDDYFDHFADIETAADNVNPYKHYHAVGDETANFDAFGHYLLNMSCVSTAYSEDGTGGSQVVHTIAPDVSPGSTIRSRPINPIPCSAPALVGTTSSIRFRMTTNLGDNAHLEEAYSARILITW